LRRRIGFSLRVYERIGGNPPIPNALPAEINLCLTGTKLKVNIFAQSFPIAGAIAGTELGVR
jgi:hypothetical protein